MEKANVIILAGQSNAVGVGHNKYLPNHFDAKTIQKFYDGYENVLINYFSHGIRSNGFVKTRVNCTQAAKDTLGPEVGIAKNLTKRYGNEKFFIIKYAFGGANLYKDWLSQSSGGLYDPNSSADKYDDIVGAVESGINMGYGWCYNGFIKLMNESIELLKKQGYMPNIRAFFWMQGESDAFSLEAVKRYKGLYDNFIQDIKTNFAPYIADCIYVDAGISNFWPCYKEMNELKKENAKEKGYVYIDTIGAGLTTDFEPIEQPDRAHYDSNSIVELGELFAQNIVL